MTVAKLYPKKNADEIEALRQKIENGLQAMEDTFGPEDHRVATMARRLTQILNDDHGGYGVQIAAAYTDFCLSRPDDLVHEPTKPCRCDFGWVEVEETEVGQTPFVRPCSRCNADLYTKLFEGPTEAEYRVAEEHGAARGPSRPDPDEEVW